MCWLPVGTAAQVGHAKSHVLKVGNFFGCLQCPAVGKELINYNDSESHYNDSERAVVIKGMRLMLKLILKTNSRKELILHWSKFLVLVWQYLATK